MNSKIENRLSMYRTVEKICDKAEPDLQMISGLWSNYQLFKTTLNELDNAIKGQIKELSGLAIAKAKAKEKLIQSLILITGMSKAYAREIQDDDLFATLHVTVSSLKKLRDDTLLEKASEIKDTINIHSSHLAPYGFTIPLWNDFLNTLHDYAVKEQAPTVGLKTRVVLTKEIELIDKRIREILSDRLDTAMQVIGLTNPILLKNYTASRAIINRPGGRKAAEDIEKASIGGMVTDENGDGIADALVSIIGTDISMYTDEEGEYLIDTLQAGTYSIAVQAEGFSDATETNIAIKNGEVLTIDFLLTAPQVS